MISSIGNSYATTTALRSLRTASSSAFGTAMTQISTPTATSDTATISDAAKAAVASNDVAVSGGPYGSYTKQQLAQAAHDISASQGLPDGKYDFTQMTGKQLTNVVDDMITNKGVSADSIKGLKMLSLFAQISADNGNPDQSHNVTAELQAGAQFASSTGDVANAKMWNDTIAFISSIAGSTARNGAATAYLRSSADAGNLGG